MQPTIHWEGKAEYLLRQYLALCYLLKGSLERMCCKFIVICRENFILNLLEERIVKRFLCLQKWWMRRER
jgi:hypothetical protein